MNGADKLGEKLDAFDRTKDLEHLREALATVESFDSATVGSDRVATRRHGTDQWMRVLSAIERHLDPKWDPENVPDTRVTPPPSNGVQFPPGVDPKHLTDPQARAEYEKAIQKNLDKAKQYEFQLQLQRLDSRAMAGAERFISNTYAKSQTDRREFETTPAVASIAPARRQRLELYWR